MQLPSVQLDSIVEDAVDVFVANRNPQPGEVQIPTTEAIQFDMYGGLGSLDIWVNDVLAVSFGAPGGPYFNGWSLVSTALPGSIGYRLRLKHADPFTNGQRVHVKLQSGAQLEFWSFTTYDTQPPLIHAVVPVDKDTLRVTFSEPVFMGDVNAGDALNAGSYAIERVSRPAATPVVMHVDYVSPVEVLLTTSFELSFGADYMLVVSGVTDEFGNAFLPPLNVFEFRGFLPPFPAGRRWVLHDFVPRMSLYEDTTGDLVLFLGILQDTSNLLLNSIDRWIEIIDPDTAPESFVDAMLVDLGNPFPFELTPGQKRQLAKILVLIYGLKGTAPGIVNLVRFFLGIEVTIETFVGRGWIIGHHQLSTTGTEAPNPAIIGPGQHALYCFRVLTDVILTDKQRDYITTIALYMKGAQEHLVGIRDGTPLISPDGWWIIAKTRIGYSKIWHQGRRSAKAITSFVLGEYEGSGGSGPF